MLAGPIAYSLATVGKTLNGGDPLAGPASAELGVGGPGGGAAGGGFGRGIGLRAGNPPGAAGMAPGAGAPSGGVPVGAPPAGAEAGSGSPPNLFGNGVRAGSGTSAGANADGSVGGALPAGTLAGPSRGSGSAARLGAGAGVGAGPGANVSKALISYLKAHQGKANYLVAAVGSSTAGPIALQSGRNVIDMGGFMGSDPAPNLAKLKSFIASGQLHYVLLSSGGGTGGAVGALVAG